MAVEIVKRTEQARGAFNGGEILENKPIGFPREGGKLKPYSNLFYWAHAWTDEGSTIGLHPHQGFEIMSFVLEGDIEHYDTKDNVWKPIEKGGAQIIRSGNGISHSERMNAGSHMFQIWFDPDLGKTLEQPASYDDYTDDAFPVSQEGGVKSKIYKGEGAPIRMDSPGVEIKELEIQEGEQEINLDPTKVYSIYLISGEAQLEQGEMNAHDFVRVEGESSWKLNSKGHSHWFLVANPSKLEYKTYAERAQAMMR